MRERSFSVLGIDQTGAVNTKGRPRPLPACLISGDDVSLFYLESFSEELVSSYNPDLICLDCVLGLPTSTGLNLRDVLEKTKRHGRFGRAEAQTFFSKLIEGEKPVREVEMSLGANSVFTVYPFQKNIQTGTFRFWKEMAENPNWFYLPALPGEKQLKKGRIPIVEGYPSYCWKILFEQNRRKPTEIVKLLSAKFPKLKLRRGDEASLKTDENLGDAMMLALAAREFKDEIHRRSHPEGWIIGYT